MRSFIARFKSGNTVLIDRAMVPREEAVSIINTHDAMQVRAYELEQERAQLKAQNAELRDRLQWINDYPLTKSDATTSLLNKNPAACLADIQVKTIEDLITEFNAEYYGEDLCQWLEQQADKRRPQAKDQP